MSRRTLLLVALGLLLLLASTAVWLATHPQALLGIAVRRERAAGALEVHRVELLTGETRHEVLYLDGGDPSGPPVLLLHGFAADKDNWTRFSASLRRAGFRVIAPDLPGHGESSRSPGHVYSVANQVLAVEALRAHLGLERVHLAGNSMGGHIAAAYAAAHGERVLSLGLFDPGGVTSPIPSERARVMAETGENPLLVNSVQDYDRMLAFVFVTPPSMPRVVKQYFADRAVAHRAFNDKMFGDLLANPLPMEPLLPSIEAPSLILWGDSDQVLHPSGAQVYAAGLPNAETVMMTAMGHAPMIERPEETAGIYIDFLNRSIEDREE